MLDQHSSLRLNLLRFPLIVGVVFIHAQDSTVAFAGSEAGVQNPDLIVSFVKDFISDGIARVAVPLFFLMSGYLFFVGFEFTKQTYLSKLKSRAKTLLIPFLFWNILTLAIYALAQSIPTTQGFFSGKDPRISTYHLLDYINAIFGLNRPPISYQFWFIRDLMIMVLWVPFIDKVNKFAPLPFLAIVSACWCLEFWPIYLPTVTSVLFFSVGAYLASRNQSLLGLDSYGKIIAPIYLGVVIGYCLCIDQPWAPYVYRLAILLGVATALWITQWVATHQPLKSIVLALSGSSFFVYAIHEPLLTILRKVSYKILVPNSSLMVLVLYVTIPVIVIGVGVIAYRGLSKLTPQFLSVICGGR